MTNNNIEYTLNDSARHEQPLLNPCSGSKVDHSDKSNSHNEIDLPEHGNSQFYIQ